MRWAVAVIVAALVAVVGASALLLRYAGDTHDPVGQLSPVAELPSPSPQTTPRTTTARPGDNGGRERNGVDD